MNSNDLTVWGVGSPRAFRVHWMLCEMGLPYDTVRYSARSAETTSVEFGKLNPRRKVPVFRHGDLVLTESAAILNYIVDAFPVPDQIHAPNDPRERARFSEWSYFVMTELDATSLYVIRRHQELFHIFGEAPAAVAAARSYFLQNIQAMAPRIAQANPFLFSPKLSVADIMLAGCLEWATSLELSLPEPAMRYLERIRARPAFIEAIKRNAIT